MNAPSNVYLSRRARNDLLEIWLYLAETNPVAADRVLGDIEKTFAMLAEHPRSGRERQELMAGIRSFAVLSWVVFYRVEGDAVTVARIVHGARDLDEIDY